MSTHQQIDELVRGNPVVPVHEGHRPVFRSAASPAARCRSLKACGVSQITTVNVLEDPAIRQGIKDYSAGRTIPQLYINGEFVGGSGHHDGDVPDPASCSDCWPEGLMPDAMTAPATRPRLVVGITGASGAAYGVRLLERARDLGVETHLVVTPSGVLNVHHECGLDRRALESLAAVAHAPGEIGACIASGSFDTAAMVIAPCTMKTLAAIAHGFGDNLLTRAADVTLGSAAA